MYWLFEIWSLYCQKEIWVGNYSCDLKDWQYCIKYLNFRIYFECEVDMLILVWEIISEWSLFLDELLYLGVWFEDTDFAIWYLYDSGPVIQPF